MKKILFAVDPGSNETGVAVFIDGVLTSAHLLRRAKTVRDPLAIAASFAYQFEELVEQTLSSVYVDSESRLVIERQHIYKKTGDPLTAQRPDQKADPNDILKLAYVTGAISASFEAKDVQSFEPSQWKGQVPKDVIIARVQNALTPAARKLVDASAPASLVHNVYEAVAIGFFALKKGG